MPGRRRPNALSFEEWESRQRELHPDWKRRVQGFAKQTGIPRKVPLLLDENLEAIIADDLRMVKDFKVTFAGKGATDVALWARARKERLVLVTADDDFWDDATYPVRDSPGLILISGDTIESKTTALARAVVSWEVIWRYRMEPDAMAGWKIRANRSGTSMKWWSGNEVVTSST